MQHLISESVRRKMKQDKGRRVLAVCGGELARSSAGDKVVGALVDRKVRGNFSEKVTLYPLRVPHLFQFLFTFFRFKPP